MPDDVPTSEKARRHALFTELQAGAPVALSTQADILRIGATVMICAAVFQCFDAVGIVFAGALRGAGDTFWPMVITFVMAWTMVIGGGAAMIRWMPQLQSIGPWIAASAYVIVLGLVMAWRFESGAWRKIDLLGRRPPAAVAPGPEAITIPVPGPTTPADHDERLQSREC